MYEKESFGECGGDFCAASPEVVLKCAKETESVRTQFIAQIAGVPVELGYSNPAAFSKYSSTGAAKLVAACGTKIRRVYVDPTTQPRTIPLYIPLGPNLTDPAEITYAQAVAAHLSGECGRIVEVSELKGLFLYLWSEDDPDGRALNDYLGDNRCPLQALLMQIRNLEGHAESLVSAELLPFIGQRFEI